VIIQKKGPPVTGDFIFWNFSQKLFSPGATTGLIIKFTAMPVVGYLLKLDG